MHICEESLPRLADYARSGRVVVFDTETTGCSRWDEICQIAAVEYINGKQARTFMRYICPTCEMNSFAEGVHGLSMDFLQERGISPEEAMRQFFAFVGEDALLVAHNAKFDLRMLQQECAKFDLESAPKGLETCDTLALARFRRPDLDCHALCRLIDALGLDAENNHDALDDAYACAEVFFAMLNGHAARIESATKTSCA